MFLGLRLEYSMAFVWLSQYYILSSSFLLDLMLYWPTELLPFVISVPCFLFVCLFCWPSCILFLQETSFLVLIRHERIRFKENTLHERLYMPESLPIDDGLDTIIKPSARWNIGRQIMDYNNDYRSLELSLLSKIFCFYVPGKLKLFRLEPTFTLFNILYIFWPPGSYWLIVLPLKPCLVSSFLHFC